MIYARETGPDDWEAEARVKSPDVPSAPTALETQKGGDHYKIMAMQPFVFTMANGWDSLAHTILKYVTRHRIKEGKLDLEKAFHCVELREELVDSLPYEYVHIIAVERFCEVNKLGETESKILGWLDEWIECPEDPNKVVPQIKQALLALIEEYR